MIRMSEAIEWIRMLSTKLKPTLIVGIFIIYGLGQGFSGSLFRLVVDYYWKDVQLLQPSSLQFYLSLFFIPWILKPLWGILTDAFPICGFHRRPYFIISGLIGTLSAFVLALSPNLHVGPALVCFIGVSASLAIADVTIDACIARTSIELREVASDLQTLCGLCSSVASLIGFLLSGFFVHHLGPQRSLSLLALSPAFTTVLGFVIYEHRTSGLHHEKKQVVERVGVTIRSMYQTIMYPQVWKPSLYMFLSLALNVTTHEGHFYWYTDSKAGPAFSQEFVGVIYAIGAVASIMGVIIYQKALKDYPFRKLLFYAQLLYALSGVVDLIFVLRWNLIIGIPDYLFVVIEETATRITGKLRWMPMMVLSTQLCPLGIEGTFFALLMCIDSIGTLLSKMGGGVLLRILHITRTDFANLWLAVLVRDMLRFATLALIFLVPKAAQHEGLLPSHHLEQNVTHHNIDEETLELVPIKGET
ncbi:hypothetical protein Lal_00039393 [Lupinus albus]|uniref:Putative folate-biopterin transporter, major facilitator superfamily domain-containing protein n=1 Tax=Lupinus albus TaxID=3870 RepID=A0A6A4PEB5_LUPAL|nr:putative folate-biopterin transporter, major facilitator superfamily domain-containing protein [Lupinus albus]KAF1885561.1 hypothetical protein Lal_00039393 [Lupinus albus]